MAAFHWSSDHFWHASTFDITDALDGYRLLNDPDYAKKQRYKKFLNSFEEE